MDQHSVHAAATVRDRRQRSMLSQAELARRAGVSVRTIRNVESGRVLPHGATLDRILRSLPPDDPVISPDRIRARQMPPTARIVVGRERELATIGTALSAGDGATGRLVLLTGMAGAGKSTLALRALELASPGRLCDELYVDLRGSGGDPLEPAEVLGRFLRALGTEPARVPDGPEERTALFRSIVASRPVAVVLDDAGTEEQVRPLLPGSGASIVIVTSRNRLLGLAVDAAVDVGPLRGDGAAELLRAASLRAFGPADDAHLRVIIDSCGGLPLALYIAGTRLAARRSLTVEELGRELADRSRRLDALVVGDLAVRASLGVTYEAMPVADRRLFRALALVDAPSFPSWVAAAVVDRPARSGTAVLDGLVTAKFVDEISSATYRMHALTALFGREQAVREDPVARRDHGARRIVHGWLQLAEAAHARLGLGYRLRLADSAGVPAGGSATTWCLRDDEVAEAVADPAAWFEQNLPSLIWAVRAAAPDPSLASRLVEAMVSYLQCHNLWLELRAIVETALSSAYGAADTRAEANLLRLLANWYAGRGELAAALHHYTVAMARATKSGDPWCAAHIGQGMAYVHRSRGDHAQARVQIDAALELARIDGDPWTVALCEYERGRVLLDSGEPEPASRALQRALELARTAGDARLAACAESRLGEAAMRRGDLDDARLRLHGALATFRELGDRQVTGYFACSLAEVLLAAGDAAAAAAHVVEAAECAELVNDDRCRARVLELRAELAFRDRDRVRARHELERATQLYERLGLDEDARRAGRRLLGAGAEILR